MNVQRQLDNTLLDIIRKQIQASPRYGTREDETVRPCITFREYMSLCLYHPEGGYYRSGKARVGREGDFYTSAYIGDIMGEVLAERLVRLADERFPDGGPVEAVDWGGGTGRLSAQMLNAWLRLGEEGARFRITVVDGDPEHRRQAEELLAEHIEAGRARVISTEHAEEQAWQERQVAVIANELLDAFPVHRIVRRGGRIWEWGVCWDERRQALSPCLTEPSDFRLEEWLNKQNILLAEGQTTEIGLDGAEWTARLGTMLGDAILIFIDYGDSTAELTGSHRMDGTLLCYEDHRAHDDPYRSPGRQDLTAHVDFDLIRSYALRAGWRELAYATQKRFLVESGVLTKLATHEFTDPFHPVVRRNRSIRQLLLSDGMSELFKVQIWVK
ncbi:class I SAM-dependent methyltransferase [Cohnella pontilimi]|uniref:class I SAM-dependent methyltransferase n=1 Tax=Cohnella pontilimi TaxID=2564100 RepID=UPI00145DB626|nr:SAM-dependent methyltransferase [Cohnella pontilimi]